MNGVFDVMKSGLLVPAGAVQDEQRLSMAYDLDPDALLEGYIHYETALSFAKSFGNMHNPRRVLSLWKHLAQKAFATEPPLYNQVNNFGFRTDFVVSEAREIAEWLNASSVDRRAGIAYESSALLVHLANVQLSAEPPIDVTKSCSPVDVNRAIPAQ